MDKYIIECNIIDERYNNNEITIYDKYLLLEAVSEKFNKKKSEIGRIEDLNKMISQLEKDYKKTKKEIEPLVKDMNYKEAVNKLKVIDSSCNKCIVYLRKMKEYTIESIYERKNKILTKISNEVKEKLSELTKLKNKKNINKFNNKYWMDYTKQHNQAFQDVEKEMLGYNTKAGKNHDIDKWIMYHFLPAPAAHALHTQFSKHHKRRARTEEDYRNMLIDWESNRRTKPDKQLKPYQILAKFYPELKDDMIPIMKKYGIPTNEKEDKKMTKKRKIQ